MSETPAEEREGWLRDISPYLGKQGHGQSQIISRLINHVDRLEKEQETEAKRWVEYLDWLSWIADCANDPNYGSEAERLIRVAEAVKEQEKKETPPFVDFIWDRMIAAEERAVRAEAERDELVKAVEAGQ